MNIRETKPGDDSWPQVADLFPRAAGWLNDPRETGDYRFFVATDDHGSLLGGSVVEIGTLWFGSLSDVRAGFLEDIEVLEPHREKVLSSRGFDTATELLNERTSQKAKKT